MGKCPLSKSPMIDTQLTLGKTPSLEFNAAKLIIWMVKSTIIFTFILRFKVLELPLCKEKDERKHLMDSSTVSWYNITYGAICSREFKESTYVSVKCDRFEKPKRVWFDTLIKDMDTNGLKLCQILVYFEIYVCDNRKKGCVV